MNVARLAGTARLKHAQTGCLHPLAGMRTPEPFEIADQRRRINSTPARFPRGRKGAAPQGRAEHRVVDEKRTARLCGDGRHEKGGGGWWLTTSENNKPAEAGLLFGAKRLLVTTSGGLLALAA